jgi:hypothetical protein
MGSPVVGKGLRVRRLTRSSGRMSHSGIGPVTSLKIKIQLILAIFHASAD